MLPKNFEQPRFSNLLAEQGIDKETATGCDIVRIVRDHSDQIVTDAGAARTVRREEDPPCFFEMAAEYDAAARKQIVSVGSDEVGQRRWADHLPEGAHLKKYHKIVIGIDEYRAAQSQANSIGSRNGNSQTFLEEVNVIRGNLPEDKYISFWRHDIKNLMTSISTYVELHSLSLQEKSEEVLEIIDQMAYLLNRFNYFNTNDLFDYVNNEFLPCLNQLTVGLGIRGGLSE